MLIGLYLTAIVLANLSVTTFGPGVAVLNAFIFIGLDITARDSLHERWQYQHLRRNMALLIISGSALSAALNWQAAGIALASCLAFAGAATADTLVYHRLHDRTRWFKINGSNVVSAAVDSLLFPALAWGFPLMWGIVLGQFVAKVAGGAIWAWVLTRRDVVMEQSA